MSRRIPADPFGASLLDVLSNLFGGLILLMILVAVLINNDKRRRNLPDEGALGRIATESDASPVSPPEDTPSCLMIEIELIGVLAHQTRLALSSQVSGVLIEPSPVKPGSWLILRQGTYHDTWRVKLQGAIDSARVRIKLDANILCEGTRAWNRSGPFMRVQHLGKEDPDITFLSQSCPIN